MIFLLGCAFIGAIGGSPGGLGSGSDTDDTSGGDSTDTQDSDEVGLCADAPVVTWANWGHGFMIEACQGCHASTATDRYGAPDSVAFDTIEEVYQWRERILYRAVGEDPTMPPGGGTTEDDVYFLQVWLSCWIEAELAD